MKNLRPFYFGSFQKQIDQRLERWETQKISRRIWAKDPSLWSPVPQPEITDRLGWLVLPEKMPSKCDEILSFVREIREEGYSHVLLLGMGGSSLAPEVFQRTFGSAPGYPELYVLDSTHPAAILAMEKRLDLSRSLFLVSSKSGTTLETISLFHYFWHRVSEIHRRPGQCFVAITDAGSPLERMAKDRRFRRTFLPAPDVGGRYSALTEFGLLPAALLGVDIQKLLERARAGSANSRLPGAEKKSPGFILGLSLGELARQRDKLTIWTTPALDDFPSWLEQLIAESIGKKGRGIVPVVGEPLGPPEFYGQDRIFIGFFLEGEKSPILEKQLLALEALGHPIIRIDLKERLDLGLEIFRWELATAAIGVVLGIHPFNQPDVQLAKDMTQKEMESHKKTTSFVDVLSVDEEKTCAAALKNLFLTARPGDYIALQAYLPPSPAIIQALQEMRRSFFKKTRLATTLGFGPRFLHSTGQLHKGGPNTMLAIQITDEPEQDLPVPEMNFSFAALIRAQSLGDYRALLKKKRRVLRISLKQDAIEGLNKLGGFI